MVEQSELEHSWMLVESEEQFNEAVDAIRAGSGPIGIDAERASGYKYYPDAYLIQASRRDSGTFLFDPTQLQTLLPLADAIAEEEWILHAASQDLACLADVGLVPQTLFDTELAARLLGFNRVGLGAIVEELLGIRLAKAHSAADWSVRPLPDDWLDYAALDVTLLPDLRDAIFEQLEQENKIEIAFQEFEAVRVKPPKTPHAEPWRRLSGSHKLRNRQSLAVARQLWLARDELAREINTAPGRLLPDASIVFAAETLPRSMRDLARESAFRGRASRSELPRWWSAITEGKLSDNPPLPRSAERPSMPHHRTWSTKNPEAAARLTTARDRLGAEAEKLSIPLENLLAPDHLRKVAWNPPDAFDADAISNALQELGARPWQRSATSQIIASAFVDSQ